MIRLRPSLETNTERHRDVVAGERSLIQHSGRIPLNTETGVIEMLLCAFLIAGIE